MRDIRGDLQERASLVEQQINAAQNQFAKLVEQLKSEHDSRAIDLKATLIAVTMVIEIEHRRLGSATSAPKSRPQESLIDFLVRKLREAGPMSSEDLGRLVVQEEYFPIGHSAQDGGSRPDTAASERKVRAHRSRRRHQAETSRLNIIGLYEGFDSWAGKAGCRL